MTDTGDPNTLGAAPWYTSAVYKGIAVSMATGVAGYLPGLFRWLGWTSPEAIHSGIELLFQGAALIAAGYALRKRTTSSIQPLTLTQAKADAHPATAVANAKETSK